MAESPVGKLVKGMWTSVSGITTDLINAPGYLVSTLVPGKEQKLPPMVVERDFQSEWTRPYSSGSPMKKAEAGPADVEEFSDFNFWKQTPLPATMVEEDDSETNDFSEVNFWKQPMPTLEELEARK